MRSFLPFPSFSLLLLAVVLCLNIEITVTFTRSIELLNFIGFSNELCTNSLEWIKHHCAFHSVSPTVRPSALYFGLFYCRCTSRSAFHVEARTLFVDMS